MSSFTLGGVAAKTDILVVSCKRCERVDRYPLPSLIEQYSWIFTIPDLLRELSKDCPEQKSLNQYDLCGLCCPELPSLFIPKRLAEAMSAWSC